MFFNRKRKWIENFLSDLKQGHPVLANNFDGKNYPLFFSVSIKDILDSVDEERARSYLMSQDIVTNVGYQDLIFGKAPDVEGLYCSFAYDRGGMAARFCHSDVRIAFGQYVATILDGLGHRAKDTEEYDNLCELNK